MKFNRDCKSFIENHVCEVMASEDYKDCEECKFYEQISKKILIIKLGAMGDVLRTTPILSALRKKYGSDIHITWLVKEESLPLLQKNPYINKILVYNFTNIQRLKHEKFHILINLDIDSEATLASNEVKAEQKYGYYFNHDGCPSAYNKSAEYYLNRIYSNQANRNNSKTYQEMMFEIADLPYDKEEIILKNIDNNYAETFMKNYSLTKKDKILGINVGSGGRWPSKAWHSEKLIEFIKIVKDEYKIILLGGPEEKEKISELISSLNKKGILANNPDNSISEFISVVNLCDIILTGDSLALHIATALKKPTMALFFCTPPQEIESYSNIKKITSPLLNRYFYADFYSEELTKSISIEEVLKCLNTL